MKTEILYILDRSGSMASVWDDAFNGLNSFIEEQKKIEGETGFTLSVFDTKFDTIICKEDIQHVYPLTSDQVSPRSMTALYDAIGKSVAEADERIKKMTDKPEKVIVVIMTDGHENSSREYNHDSIQKIIKEKETKQDWEFMFIGNGLDVTQIACNLGMKSMNTKSFSKDAVGYKDASLYASATVSLHRTNK